MTFFSFLMTDHTIRARLEVFHRLHKANFTPKLAKSVLVATIVFYPGHQVGSSCMQPKTANVTAVFRTHFLLLARGCVASSVW